jgi:propanol-preferring alcohol dehydrogenase
MRTAVGGQPDHQDGLDFLRIAPEIGSVTRTTSYPLTQVNQTLADQRAGKFDDVAMLVS